MNTHFSSNLLAFWSSSDRNVFFRLIVSFSAFKRVHFQQNLTFNKAETFFLELKLTKSELEEVVPFIFGLDSLPETPRT